MIRLAPAPTFKFTAKIRTPGGGSLDLPLVGKVKSRTELASILRGSADAAAAQVETIGADAAAMARAGLERDADALLSLLHGWGADVRGADDQPLPFCRDSLLLLLDSFHSAAAAIFDAYLREYGTAATGN